MRFFGSGATSPALTELQSIAKACTCSDWEQEREQRLDRAISGKRTIIQRSLGHERCWAKLGRQGMEYSLSVNRAVEQCVTQQ